MNDHSRAVCAVILGMFGSSGCTGKEATDTFPDLPDEETGAIDTDTGPFVIPDDTSVDPDLDEEPNHWLHLYQDGSWLLSPSGGPYNTMTGTLEVTEIMDYERPAETDTGVPWDTAEEDPVICEVTYNLIGSKPESSSGCDGCSVIMDIEFIVTAGNPSDCRDGDLPQSGSSRRFGFHPGTNRILFNYYNTGVWVPWYSATKAGDTVTFTWEGTYGISVEDEEEE